MRHYTYVKMIRERDLLATASTTDTALLAPIPDLAAPDAPFGIYLHVPFCVRKCRYCDFVTYAGRNALIPDYVAALIADIESTPRRWPGELPRVSSVFWGGGTPSLLPAESFGRIHDAIERTFGWQFARAAVEITIEANPDTVDEAYLRTAYAGGVNRISLGVQSFQEAGLCALDRDHDAATIARAVAATRSAGIDAVSLDLIFGWDGQTDAAWQADLAAALALTPQHLSLYALTIEDGSALAADIARGRVGAPDDDRQADFYERAVAMLGAAGYEGYEISNWARRTPGDPSGLHRSRHNSLYWRNGEYLGFGIGAHSHYRGERFGNGRLVRRYIESARDALVVSSFSETIDAPTAMAETMMLGLRLLEGIDRHAFQRRHGLTLDAAYGSQLAGLAPLGVLHDDGARLCLTPRGRLVANEVLVRFLPEAAS